MAADISPELALTSQGEKDWLVTFSTSKTKLVAFHLRRTDHEVLSISLNGCPLGDAPSLERILDLNLTLDLKWNSFIRSIKKNSGKMIGSLYHSRKHLTTHDVLYIYKSQIRSKIRYCCHFGAIATKS